MNAPDHQFEQRARRLYREAGQRLDPAIAGRLRAARREALEAAAPGAQRARPARLLLPAGAFAAVALAVLIVWQPPQRHAATALPSPAQALDIDGDLPPDADSADPNLYQNLDFYGWLAASDSPSDDR